MKTLRADIAHLMTEHEKVTVAGVCYLLRGEYQPAVTFAEAEAALESLVRLAWAERLPDNGCGTEYKKR